MIVAGFMIGAVAHAAEPPLSLAGGETTRPLTFTKSGDSESATLTLIVRNGGDVGGTLLVRFVDESGATAKVTATAPVEASNPPPTQKPPTPAPGTRSLTVRLLPPSTLAVEPHDATQLRLEFRRNAKSAKGKAVSGNLIIALAKTPLDPVAGPVVVALTINEKVADLKFAQEKATISLTRLLGPLGALASHCTKCLIAESVRVETRGLTPKTAETTINSDTGGSATVKLKRNSDSRSSLRVTRLDRHGAYAGKLVLDPDAEKPRSLAVDIKTRDFLLWPLTFVLAGAWFGARVLRWNDVRRNRNLVQAMIKDSVDPYLDARKGPDGPDKRPDRFYLKDLLPTDGSPVYPQGNDCANPDNLAPVPGLYCKAASIDGEQALSDLLPEVTEITGNFDRWRKVEEAIDALKGAVATLPDDARYNPMREDAALLAVRADVEPNDDRAASELVLLFHEEAAVAAAYNHARQMYDKQPDGWRDMHKKVDPTLDLAALPGPAIRTAANAEQGALTLLYKAAALQHPERIPPDSEPDEQEARLDELMESFSVRRARRFLQPDLQGIVIAARDLASDNVDTRTPEQIRAEVRKTDTEIFWITAALTALVYLAGKYSASWGSWEDYLFAFAAGAVAPTVITWSLLPITRSYRPQAAAKPAAADAE